MQKIGMQEASFQEASMQTVGMQEASFQEAGMQTVGTQGAGIWYPGSFPISLQRQQRAQLLR